MKDSAAVHKSAYASFRSGFEQIACAQHIGIPVILIRELGFSKSSRDVIDDVYTVARFLKTFLVAQVSSDTPGRTLIQQGKRTRFANECRDIVAGLRQDSAQVAAGKPGSASY